MAETTRLLFAHRKNPDGSFDSICNRCYQTVATAKIEAELDAFEGEHICGRFNLRDILHPEKSR
jgi:hypothetical protein